MHKRIQYALLFLITAAMAFCVLPQALAAQDTLILDRPQRYNLNPYFEILEDPSGQLEISDVISPPYANQFEAHSKQSAPNFSYTRSAIWLKLAVQNLDPQNHWILYMDYPLLDQVDLYIYDRQHVIFQQQSGAAFPFRTRDVDHRNIAFRIPPSFAGGDVYIRVQSQYAVITGATIMDLESFTFFSQKEYMLLGLYYGMVLLVFLTILSLYILTKTKDYLYYLLYTLSVGLFLWVYNGLAFQYWWPDHPWWARQCLVFFITLASASVVLLTSKILPIKKHAPVFSKLVKALWIAAACITPLTLVLDFTFAMRLGIAIVLVSAVTGLYAAVLCWRKQYRPARYLLIGWLGLALGVFLTSGRSLGWLPDSFMTMYGVQMGFTAQIILITTGLADRIYLLKQQKELAQEKNRKLALERQKLRHVQMLNKMSEEISFDQDFPDVVEKMLVYIRQQVPYDYSCFLVKKGDRFLPFARLSQDGSAAIERRDKTPFAEPVFTEALTKQEPMVFNHIHKISPFAYYPHHYGTRSAIVVPMRYSENYAGIMVLERKSKKFSNLEVSMAESFAGQASTHIENVQLFQEVRILTIKDELTGLYNRRYLYTQGQKEFLKAQRYQTPLSVVIFDIDDFKAVNDRYGHAAGDTVLKALARRCLAQLRSIDIASRYGGEEFVLILPQTAIVDGQKAAERLRIAIASDTISVNDHDCITITASFGVASLKQDRDFETLLGRADAALLEAKRTGKNKTVTSRPS